jgi:hypothetical protein
MAIFLAIARLFLHLIEILEPMAWQISLTPESYFLPPDLSSPFVFFRSSFASAFDRATCQAENI